jgi:hypothetical protein
MKSAIAALAAAGFAVCVSPALAQEGAYPSDQAAPLAGPEASRGYEADGRRDRGADRRTRKAERKFSRLDRNGDGALTRDEYSPGRRRASAASADAAQETQRPRRDRFARLDRDGDGAISREEYLRRSERRMSRRAERRERSPAQDPAAPAD